MPNPCKEDKIMRRLIEWGEGQPLVRAMLLTSSRAIPNGTSDILSDYDVILVLTDVHPFVEDRTWLEAFGRVLALYVDPLEPYHGCLKSGNVTQYESGLKIDFSLWPAEIIQRIAADPSMPAEFDAGYLVLLDKDHLTDGLMPPTYKANIPTPPTEAQYQTHIENFFLDACYVAKFLWRDDLIAARHILEAFMLQENLRPMLEWHIEINHGWSVKPGLYGQRMKRWLRADLWAELEGTYVGAGLEENWEALFRTIALMRKAALEVGERLGYAYPHELERRAVAYLYRVKNLEPEAACFVV